MPGGIFSGRERTMSEELIEIIIEIAILVARLVAAWQAG
jgi:hypothetical protein